MPTLVVTISLVVAVWAPSIGRAEAASTLPVLTRHSVLGTGSTGDLFVNITVDARSDASGGNVSGTVSFDVVGIHVGGPITCLQTHDGQAVIGFDDTMGPFGQLTVDVVDNGVTGDTFGALPDTPTDCIHLPAGFGGTDQVLVSGNLTVRDVPALTRKAQCRKRGWRQFTTLTGAYAFKNARQCMAFVARSRHA